MKGVFVTVLVVVAMVQFMVNQGEAISCIEVNASLASCLPFLSLGTGNPSTMCCTGVRTLRAITPTAADRRTACNCVKQAASRVSIKEDAASALPQRCGVEMNIPFSMQIDCDSIN